MIELQTTLKSSNNNRVWSADWYVNFNIEASSIELISCCWI